MDFTVALSGDSIITRRLSVCTEERFLALVDLFRNADVAYTHLEMLLLDYTDPEVYPAAEGGWTWMRAPKFIAAELKWAGIDIVSHASNHSLDYSYGGLYSTWETLLQAGLPFAGTGRNLGEAREPAYLDHGKARVALISASTSFGNWTRAGEARWDIQGRPGLNPLRYHFKVNPETLHALKDLAMKMGLWITPAGNEWLINPPGLHNTVYRFVEADVEGMEAVANEDDVQGNLRSVRDAKAKADFVMVHLHNHEWDTRKDLTVPPPFVQSYARACIDAGADLFIAEGSHSYLRGIEIYKGKPIFYDPGDLFRTRESVIRLPSDFYLRPGYNPEARRWDATSAEGFAARTTLPEAVNPPGGYLTARVVGIVIPVCVFGEGLELKEIKLYPATHLKKPKTNKGFPGLESGQMARDLIAFVGELSAPFGTKVEFEDGIGLIKI